MEASTDNQRPKFLTSYLEALRESAKLRGWYAVFPIWIVGSLSVGFGVAYFVPTEFWLNSKWDVSTAVYAGILTFNGLVLALSWSAFSKIYEIIGSAGFCGYLKKNNLLNGYILYVGYVNAAQTVAVTVSGAALIVTLLEFGIIWVDKSILAIVIAATIYAIKQASSAISGMHDLIWQKAIFDEGVEEYKFRDGSEK